MKGDKALAGNTLGISRATLYRKLKRYNIGVQTRSLRNRPPCNNCWLSGEASVGRAPPPVQAERTGAPGRARCWLDGVKQLGLVHTRSAEAEPQTETLVSL